MVERCRDNATRTRGPVDDQFSEMEADAFEMLNLFSEIDPWTTEQVHTIRDCGSVARPGSTMVYEVVSGVSK